MFSPALVYTVSTTESRLQRSDGNVPSARFTLMDAVVGWPCASRRTTEVACVSRARLRLARLSGRARTLMSVSQTTVEKRIERRDWKVRNSVSKEEGMKKRSLPLREKRMAKSTRRLGISVSCSSRSVFHHWWRLLSQPSREAREV